MQPHYLIAPIEIFPMSKIFLDLEVIWSQITIENEPLSVD
jgi:hypothetical protein